MEIVSFDIMEAQSNSDIVITRFAQRGMYQMKSFRKIEVLESKGLVIDDELKKQAEDYGFILKYRAPASLSWSWQ
ncbi:hypothetical protein [Jeotgalibacillus marinus]|uniref:Uncharacterized protein n=1 Tax=Jeotgalibacillus marinus TaxID=86667 RepID=A0ABV3Q4R6_9BACL